MNYSLIDCIIHFLIFKEEMGGAAILNEHLMCLQVYGIKSFSHPHQLSERTHSSVTVAKGISDLL